MKNVIWKVFEDVEKKYGSNELVINSHTDVFYEKENQLIPIVCNFSDADFDTFLREVVVQLHEDRDAHHPIINGILPNNVRVNIILPPLATTPVITLRKYSKKILHLDSDQSFNLSESVRNYIRNAIFLKKNIVISGGIAVGKTTFLNMLLNEFPKNERVVVIENLPEIQVENNSFVFLRPPTKYVDHNINIGTLIQNTLKMRADRLVLGSCKGSEIFHYIEALSAGVQGSLVSIHANNISDTILKLENYYQLENKDVTSDISRKRIFSTIDIIIRLGKNNKNQRCILEIYELELDIHQKAVANKVSAFDENGFLIIK